MSKLTIEKIGGYGGFGVGNSHLRSRGEIHIDELSNEDKKAVEELFRPHGKTKASLETDTFRYKISRVTSKGVESIEADEKKIPDAIKQCLKDEIV